MERYFDTFGRDQVHVVLFEDFIRDPAAAYRGVLEFLGVDPDFRPTSAVVNAGAERRSPRLQQALLSPRVIRVARGIVFPAARQAGRRTRLGPDQLAAAETAAARPAGRRGLRAELLPDIERLGTLLGRDLASSVAVSHLRQPAATVATAASTSAAVGTG